MKPFNFKQFFNLIKQVAIRYSKVLIASVAIVLFVTGFLVSWKYLIKPMNADQFVLCEQVARDVYAHSGDVIIEVPDGIKVETTTTYIQVSIYGNVGSLTAKLQNGQLTMSRSYGIAERIILCILSAALFVLVPMLIVLLPVAIKEKIEERRWKA